MTGLRKFSDRTYSWRVVSIACRVTVEVEAGKERGGAGRGVILVAVMVDEGGCVDNMS